MRVHHSPRKMNSVLGRATQQDNERWTWGGLPRPTMERENSGLKEVTMRTRFVPVLSIASLLVFGILSPSARAQTTMEWIALSVMTPSQEVPPVLESNAFGVAFLTFEELTSTLCYSISYTDGGLDNLASGETAAHFHGPARPGEAAGVQFEISPNPSPTHSPKVGCVGPLDATQRRELLSGLWYINVHSNAFPSGEIRGQIQPGAIVSPVSQLRRQR